MRPLGTLANSSITYSAPQNVIGGGANVLINFPAPPTSGAFATQITWYIDGAEQLQSYTQPRGFTTDLPNPLILPAPPVSSGSSSFNFYWNQEARIHTIGAHVDYSDGSTSDAPAISVNVLKPNVDSFRITQFALQLGVFHQPDGTSYTGLHEGDFYAGQPGVWIDSQVDTPQAQSGNFRFAILQTVDASQQIAGRTDNQGLHILNTRGPVLDDPPQQIFLNGIFETVPPNTLDQPLNRRTDGPALGGPTSEVGNPTMNYAQGVSMNDHYTTYLMFQGQIGIWVAIASASWTLSGAEHYDEGQQTWVVDQVLYPSQAQAPLITNGAAATQFVGWTDDYLSFDFSPPYNP